MLVSAALLGGAAHSNACTSIIVSGKVTPDGRPYIFKNRDTHDLDNLAVQIQGPRYRFIGIVATKDTLYKSVWSGHNEVGFAIANTAAYNLNGKPEPGKPRPQGDDNDGTLMRKALGTCRTLGDFEHLLDSIKAQGPIPSNSNFAVLDAEGGVAYYETGNKGYVKYDANDPLVAPYGFIVRTNHGMSGERSLDQGVERYLTISDYATRAAFAN
ncbi:MAG: acyl-CoA--6-aminopenicillanic acid acyl-transferase, partial [Prevotella sp.]|nr:acyl-CoA--6-aminopenicillanic acid acyl-transferase [Prevotella sp.]